LFADVSIVSNNNPVGPAGAAGQYDIRSLTIAGTTCGINWATGTGKTLHVVTFMSVTTGSTHNIILDSLTVDGLFTISAGQTVSLGTNTNLILKGGGSFAGTLTGASLTTSLYTLVSGTFDLSALASATVGGSKVVTTTSPTINVGAVALSITGTLEVQSGTVTLTKTSGSVTCAQLSMTTATSNIQTSGVSITMTAISTLNGQITVINNPATVTTFAGTGIAANFAFINNAASAALVLNAQVTGLTSVVSIGTSGSAITLSGTVTAIADGANIVLGGVVTSSASFTAAGTGKVSLSDLTAITASTFNVNIVAPTSGTATFSMAAAVSIRSLTFTGAGRLQILGSNTLTSTPNGLTMVLGAQVETNGPTLSFNAGTSSLVGSLTVTGGNPSTTFGGTVTVVDDFSYTHIGTGQLTFIGTLLNSGTDFTITATAALTLAGTSVFTMNTGTQVILAGTNAITSNAAFSGGVGNLRLGGVGSIINWAAPGNRLH